VESSPTTPSDQSKDDSKKDDSKTKLDQFLGAMKPILAEATKVEAYLVEPEINPTISEDSKLGGFPVKKGPVNLTAEQMKALKTLVLDEKSYFWGAVKKCIIRPEVALRFLKGNEEVSILFSPYCKVWTFVHQKKQANQDYALVKKSVEDLLNSLFPPTQQ
jgi:hypothetical protein